MARIIEKNIDTVNELEELSGLFDIIDISKIKITPSILVIAIAPILLAIGPLKNIIKDTAIIYILYKAAREYESKNTFL